MDAHRRCGSVGERANWDEWWETVPVDNNNYKAESCGMPKMGKNETHVRICVNTFYRKIWEMSDTKILMTLFRRRCHHVRFSVSTIGPASGGAWLNCDALVTDRPCAYIQSRMLKAYSTLQWCGAVWPLICTELAATRNWRRRPVSWNFSYRLFHHRLLIIH